MSVRSFMPVRIMHGMAMECSPLRRRVLPASGIPTVVALAIVIVMIDMPVEVFSAVIPRSRTDEHASREPLRAIVSIRSAIVRRNLVITVRALWSHANTYRNLRLRAMATRQEKGGRQSQNAGALPSVHRLTSNRVRCRRRIHLVNIVPEVTKEWVIPLVLERYGSEERPELNRKRGENPVLPKGSRCFG
jgi:hypothetical protein